MGIRTLLAAGAGLALLAAGSPAYAADGVVNTKVTGTFTTGTTQVGKQVTYQVTVTNTSTVTAHDIIVVHWVANGIAWDSADPKDSSQVDGDAIPKFDLEPGQSRVLAESGTVTKSAYADGEVMASAYVRTSGTEVPDDNISAAYIPVPGAVSDAVITATGVPWGGTDATAPVPGVKVVVSRRINRVKTVYADRTTGKDGTITLKDIPAGTYDLEFTAPDGWKITARYGQVSPGEGRVGKASVTLAATGPAPTPSATPSATPAPTTIPSAATAPPASGQGGGLPITGPDGALLGAVGAALLLAGGLVLLLARRRTPFTG